MPGFRNIPNNEPCYSNVAGPGERTLCITVSEMVMCGVSETYIWKVLKGQRDGSYYCWPHHKEGKTVYLHYQGLKPTYQATIRAVLMDNLTPEEWYNRNGRITEIRQRIADRMLAVETSEEYRNGCDDINAFVYDDGETHLPDKHKAEYKDSLKWLIFFRDNARKPLIKRMGYDRLDVFRDDMAFLMKNTGVRFPVAYNKQQDKIAGYTEKGIAALVSARLGNTNSTKISDDAGNWLIARWGSPVERYTSTRLWQEFNAVAPVKGWEQIKSRRTMEMFLNRPDVAPLWYGLRHGELKSKEKYTRINKLIPPSCRDALWYSDGTKLNFYYMDEKGNTRTCQVYEVMDAYSEVFLGYHISHSEDFEAQYHAYKMALKTSGYKPYEIRYDNQGGHKKLEAGDFLSKISHLSIRTMPYNGRSKTIESAFGRFQQQYLGRRWYFTGQNITTKKMNSRQNVEFQDFNDRKLPTFQEMITEYLELRKEWNNAPHPKTGVSRMEMYRASHNEKAVKLTMWEMVDLFWIMSDKPSTFTAAGITIEVKKRKYTYEPLTADGQPDFVFRLKHTGRKFHVCYDPDDMSMVGLYVKEATGMRFVEYAKPYLEAHRAKQDQDEYDAAFLKQMELKNKDMRVGLQQTQEELMRKEGVHPEQHGLAMPNVKGVTPSGKRPGRRRKTKDTPQPEEAENELMSVGVYEKELSNVTALEKTGRRSAYRDYYNI